LVNDLRLGRLTAGVDGQNATPAALMDIKKGPDPGPAGKTSLGNPACLASGRGYHPDLLGQVVVVVFLPNKGDQLSAWGPCRILAMFNKRCSAPRAQIKNPKALTLACAEHDLTAIR
jgi:hypothetical protein